MTRHKKAMTHQQHPSEPSQASGILQRVAISSVPEIAVQSTEETKQLTFSQSRFPKDFSAVPNSTTTALPIMAKLIVGPAGDKYEQEADRVAAEVVSRINTPVAVPSGQGKPVQREAIQIKDDEAKLMRLPIVQRLSSEGGMDATQELEASIQRARGRGQSLEDSIREPMEQALGADFSGVKVHTDRQSDQLNQSIQARAFTTGQDIFFRQRAYDPRSRIGQQLIAHELTHVVQQNGRQVQRQKAGEVGTAKLSPESSTQHAQGRGIAMPDNLAALTNLAFGVNSDFSRVKIYETAKSNTIRRSNGKKAVIGVAVGSTVAVLGYYLWRYLEKKMSSPPIFRNKVPDNLVTEIRRYLAEWRRTRTTEYEAFVVSYQADQEKFREKIKTGQKFLWTYDIDGFLSIGSTEKNQHSVVGAGKDVYAAGTGQLMIPPILENYLSYNFLMNKAQQYRQQGHEDVAIDYENNARELFSGDPPEQALDYGNKVELDFESGHYAPRDAWAKTYEAWRKAGYEVVKSTKGGHI